MSKQLNQIGADLVALLEQVQTASRHFEAYLTSLEAGSNQASPASTASAAISPVAASTAAASETPSLDDVVKAAQKLAKKSRQHLVDALAHLGVAKVSEIAESHRESALAYLTEMAA